MKKSLAFSVFVLCILAACFFLPRSGSTKSFSKLDKGLPSSTALTEDGFFFLGKDNAVYLFQGEQAELYYQKEENEFRNGVAEENLVSVFSYESELYLYAFAHDYSFLRLYQLVGRQRGKLLLELSEQQLRDGLGEGRSFYPGCTLYGGYFTVASRQGNVVKFSLRNGEILSFPASAEGDFAGLYGDTALYHRRGTGKKFLEKKDNCLIFTSEDSILDGRVTVCGSGVFSLSQMCFYSFETEQITPIEPIFSSADEIVSSGDTILLLEETTPGCYNLYEIGEKGISLLKKEISLSIQISIAATENRYTGEKGYLFFSSPYSPHQIPGAEVRCEDQFQKYVGAPDHTRLVYQYLYDIKADALYLVSVG